MITEQKGEIVSKGVFGIIVGILAVALVAAGCGGGSNDPVSKAEYVKEANATCDRSEKERSEATSKYAETADQSLPQKQMQKGLVETALPFLQDLSSELSDLSLPEQGTKQVEKFNQAFAGAVEAIETHWQVAFENPELFSESNKLAKEIGATECIT